MKATTISPEDYLRNEVSKTSQPQPEDKFNELIDHSTHLHKHEHSNKMEIEENDMTTNIHTNNQNMVQQSSYVRSKKLNQMRQKGNRSGEKQHATNKHKT